MLDQHYLIRGLDCLSNAHGANYFSDGHLGASVIAAYYLCHENSLDENTQNAIKSRLDHDLGNSRLALPAPDEVADEALLQDLVRTLAAGIGDLREVGHNVIFGAAALKAFRQCPESITTYRVDGICKLIAAFTTTQNVTLQADDEIPEAASNDTFIKFIFTEFLHSVSLYAGFGQGWAGHLLTFGHAIVELSRLGYQDLADGARPAYSMYIKTMRRGPEESDPHIPDHPPSDLTPLDHDYWKKRKKAHSGLGHDLKYACSFYNLFSRLTDPYLRERCLEESYRLF